MKNALWKDLFREIKLNKGRFLSIFCIVMLGTAFFSGLRSTGFDMKYSAIAVPEYGDMYWKGAGSLADAHTTTE